MVGMRLAVGAHKQTCEQGIHTERTPGAALADLRAQDLEGAVRSLAQRYAESTHARRRLGVCGFAAMLRVRLNADALQIGHEVLRHGAWLWVPPDTERWMWHARLTLLAVHALLTSGCGSEMRFCVVDFISGL
ncbi:hypothetical protein B0H11DRAFT_2245726 [Mycena galericulata]|nr:hypothetical protein B0H11DRAFT_2245726 [Mycena galericulata]